MSNIKICKYYQHPKKCTNDKQCGNQLLSDKNHCCSDLYYAMRLEQELQAQRDFTVQEQRKIYCVAYDKSCETGNECKQKNCVFKDRLKYKQALDEVENVLKTIMETNRVYPLQTNLQKVLNIIKKVKENEYANM